MKQFLRNLVWSWVVMSCLMGCAPYVGYTHLSQPNVANDGYDFVCGGVELTKGRVQLDGAVCENMAASRGTYARIDARILFGERE